MPAKRARMPALHWAKSLLRRNMDSLLIFSVDETGKESVKKETALIFIAVALLIGIVILLGFYGSKSTNIVLIVIDTLRADRLSSYGFAKNTSPELDRFANNGVQFKRVIAQSSWTRPSIGSMLTSRYPRSLGIYKERFDMLADSHLTLAEVLKSRGYSTVGFTANPNINAVYNFDQGFDFYQDSTAAWKFMKDTPRTANRPIAKGFQPARMIFDDALKAVEREDAYPDRRKPFYLQITVMEVHEHGKMVRPEFQNLFLDDEEAQYLQAIRQVSRDIAIFYQKLKSLPEWENTLLVITSDHGEGLLSHPSVSRSYLHGNLLYESQILVPLIFYNPADQALKNRKITEPVRLLDLMPTILDYAGIRLPNVLQGKSLLPWIKGDPANLILPNNFIVETSWRDVKKIGVYTKDWTYIENRDDWAGVNRFELQPAGILENGKVTDRIESMGHIAQPLRQYLNDWEKKHPRSKPDRQKQEPSDFEVEQMKAMGYLQ